MEERTTTIKTAWQQHGKPASIAIHVSGYRFVTTRETLNQYPHTKLGKLLHNEQSEYHFDADEEVFREVLRYQRSGELHVPKNMCKEEFISHVKFWGLNEDALSSCCRGEEVLSSHNLEKQFAWFEKRLEPDEKMTWKHHVWYFLTDPNGPYTKHKTAAKLWMLCYSLLLGVEIINMGLYTTPGELTDELNNTADASMNDVIAESMKFPCKSVKSRFQKIITDGQFYIQFLLCILFMFEISIRLFCCPKKSAFWKSLNAVDFVSCTTNFVATTIYMIFSQASIYPQEHSMCAAINFASYVVLLMVQIKMGRLLTFTTHFGDFQVLLLALYNSRKEIYLLIIIVGLSSLLCGSVIYYAELIGSAIEKKNDVGINSIPIGYWWVVVTMSTVGYGDFYPSTVMGYLTAVAIMMLGIMVTALPIAVIGANFSTLSEYNRLRQQRNDAKEEERKTCKPELEITPLD